MNLPVNPKLYVSPLMSQTRSHDVRRLSGIRASCAVGSGWCQRSLQLRLMIVIVHYVKDPKLWELWMGNAGFRPSAAELRLQDIPRSRLN